MQNKGLKRNNLDKYYTKNSIVELCVNYVKNLNLINYDNDLIIEPSAGNGSFIKEIKELSSNYVFYDIEPENNEIIKQDYLDVDLDIYKNLYKNIHIIGNPPFGRQSSLAIKFIKKSCLYAQTISFILPKSFKKESMKKYFSKNYHLIFQIDLDENSFLVNNEDCNVPCVFQIWIYKNEFRIQKDKEKNINFNFVKKNDNPDISIRRVGVYAGKISTNIEDKNEQSHYFIKFLNSNNVDENIKLLNKVNFEFNNTVGPKSISKQEIIDEFNKYII